MERGWRDEKKIEFELSHVDHVANVIKETIPEAQVQEALGKAKEIKMTVGFRLPPLPDVNYDRQLTEIGALRITPSGYGTSEYNALSSVDREKLDTLEIKIASEVKIPHLMTLNQFEEDLNAEVARAKVNGKGGVQ